MKFLPKSTTHTITQRFSGISQVEQCIEATKNTLNSQLQTITTHVTTNISSTDTSTIKKMRQLRDQLTIKPADKNLGIALLDTDDYITQCIIHLADTSTYRLAQHYPAEDITKHIHNIITSFKTQLHDYNKTLYTFLLSTPNHPQVPQFYGVPKIHKKFTRIPPVRPIVSQCNSLLNPAARFIDHVLQPLAQSYPDYIHNSTALSHILQELYTPDEAILVTMDVCSLYPSIPQTDMLQVIYEEMQNHRNLMLFDPNLIIRLLHLNINYTYFEFASVTFQQIKGTAMGAPFSPTVANIYMSVMMKRFLRTQNKLPLLLARYIDDIFIIWPHSIDDFHTFINNLNSFNPALRYTHDHSSSTIDFLDLTIFKSSYFPFTNILDTKTYQKPLNLYQYLHYSSHHQKSTFKAIITGELMRYIRTNTLECNFIAIKKLFKTRLLTRGYPERLIDKTMTTISISTRPQIMKTHQHIRPTTFPPLYKCLPPPQFKILKKIILKGYKPLQGTLPPPRFITSKHPTLRNHLVRSQMKPTDNQLVDIYLQLDDHDKESIHVTAGQLPRLRPRVKTVRCNHPRCVTCQHLNCSKEFKSTKTGISYLLRHSFCCDSSNLIYLITCRKCQKQYVGLTTKQLNVRINHHRTNIINKKQIYLCVHFNFPDHSIQDISVQAIDTISHNTPNPLQDLQKLEKYWIHTLKTIQPLGLNVSTGTSFTSFTCHQ